MSETIAVTTMFVDPEEDAAAAAGRMIESLSAGENPILFKSAAMLLLIDTVFGECREATAAERRAVTALSKGLNSYQCLSVSTTHISPETLDRISAYCKKPRADKYAFTKTATGYFVKLSGESYEADKDPQLGPDLSGFIAYAIKAGFSMIEFDLNGGFVPEFPVYDH